MGEAAGAASAPQLGEGELQQREGIGHVGRRHEEAIDEAGLEPREPAVTQRPFDDLTQVVHGPR